ncbi:MAG: hypothetical protein H6Q89_5699 [Myxococcaceae bacterium]|nr:hypothetical protein [Myxococcaceae bacterium]
MRTVLGGLAVLLAAGCSDSSPCSSCPKIEGRYLLSYEPVTIASPDCAALPAPAGQPLVEITRGGAEVRATLYGNPGRGVLTDTSDFSISAAEPPDGGSDAGTQSYTLRGYYLPPTLRGADGGEPAKILGKWITHGESGAKICDAERPFTGVRQ